MTVISRTTLIRTYRPSYGQLRKTKALVVNALYHDPFFVQHQVEANIRRASKLGIITRRGVYEKRLRCLTCNLMLHKYTSIHTFFTWRDLRSWKMWDRSFRYPNYRLQTSHYDQILGKETRERDEGLEMEKTKKRLKNRSSTNLLQLGSPVFFASWLL